MQQQPEQPEMQSQAYEAYQPQATYPYHPPYPHPQGPYQYPPRQRDTSASPSQSAQPGYQAQPYQQQPGYQVPGYATQAYAQAHAQAYAQAYAPPQAPQRYPQQLYPHYPPQGYSGPSMQQAVNINVQNAQGHGFIMRALYFIFIGWWAGFVWLHLGFALCATGILLPIGLMMLNRLPQVLTLQMPSTSTNVHVSTTMMPGTMGEAASSAQTINVHISTSVQHNFFIRAIYFIFIGWWVGYCWAILGYWCCLSIILLPVGVLMLNRLPAVLTLRKN